MKAIYQGMQITSRAYPLRTGEWMPEARVIWWSGIRGAFIEVPLYGKCPVESESHAHEMSIRFGMSWVDSN